MKTGFKWVACLLILEFASLDVLASEAQYPVQPPVDMSIYYAKPAPRHLTYRHHRRYHRHKHRYAHLAPHKTHHLAHHYQRRFRGPNGIYVYYDLPAPACCGGDCVLGKARCCAYSGDWQKSYYATFKPGQDDFTFNVTNNDDTQQADNYYNNVVIDDSIENP